MFLATEDELSEAVGLRLAREQGLEVTTLLRKGGNGYLRSRIDRFRQIAQHQPLILFTDLDTTPCPVALLDAWCGRHALPQNFIFRVVEREIEAWLLADKFAIARLFGISEAHFPDRPDELDDPKRTLLHLAERAPRAIKSELLAERGSIASQGLGYNRVLGDFVSDEWDPERASANSPSLERARKRLEQLAARLG